MIVFTEVIRFLNLLYILMRLQGELKGNIQSTNDLKLQTYFCIAHIRSILPSHAPVGKHELTSGYN